MHPTEGSFFLRTYHDTGIMVLFDSELSAVQYPLIGKFIKPIQISKVFSKPRFQGLSKQYVITQTNRL
jgi:hypothetical protein